MPTGKNERHGDTAYALALALSVRVRPCRNYIPYMVFSYYISSTYIALRFTLVYFSDLLSILQFYRPVHGVQARRCETLERVVVPSASERQAGPTPRRRANARSLGQRHISIPTIFCFLLFLHNSMLRPLATLSTYVSSAVVVHNSYTSIAR